MDMMSGGTDKEISGVEAEGRIWRLSFALHFSFVNGAWLVEGGFGFWYDWLGGLLLLPPRIFAI